MNWLVLVGLIVAVAFAAVGCASLLGVAVYRVSDRVRAWERDK